MCTLEVLLIADVMRHTTRNFDDANGVRRGARSVCRKLFACEAPTADRSRLLRRMQEEIRRQDSERWNFDFATETPLPGRYQWVRVSPEVSAPASSQTVVEECAPSDSAKTSEVRQRKSACRAEQLKITDFMNQKKRHRTSINASASPKQKVRRTSNDSQSTTTTT